MLLPVASYGQAINAVPYTITAPGNYFLNNDLSYNTTTGVAISINSSGVTLDFAGHKLTGLRISGATSTGVEHELGVAAIMSVALIVARR
jgi:hypothetical protein